MGFFKRYGAGNQKMLSFPPLKRIYVTNALRHSPKASFRSAGSRNTYKKRPILRSSYSNPIKQSNFSFLDVQKVITRKSTLACQTLFVQICNITNHYVRIYVFRST